ncbi:MAG: phosphate ABC transporter permease subunit PstC [Gammaproteobacteria bacterium]
MLAAALRAAAFVCGAFVVLMVLFVLRESWPALREIGLSRFFTDESWHPQGGAAVGTFGLVPMITASLALTAGAMALAAPLGLLCALFCSDYAPLGLATAFRRLMEVLAGIPSVVYGFWGLVVLVPLINRWQPPGASLLAGILVLALMILPTMALLAQTAIATVPADYRRGAAALGLTRVGTLWGVVLPAARSGLYTAALLAVGRAIGETMAVLMVCGNVVRSPSSLFAPVRALTANIALEMAYALDDHRSALFVSGLMLAGVVVALVFAAERLSRRVVHD